jgi:hypothetical protein
MPAVLLALALAQNPRCGPDAAALVSAATDRAASFDLAGAALRLQSAVMAGCADAEVPSIYVRGWMAARDAYRSGGSVDSLLPVRNAIQLLRARAQGSADPGQIAAFVLEAAMAASQSERDDLSLLIEHAVQLEGVRLSAGLPGLPIVTAHEAAGDLWLQVYRYDEARRAYARAADKVGVTPRITLGMARVAARVDARATACTQYRALLASWKGAGPEPPEISEARTFLTGGACPGSDTPRP